MTSSGVLQFALLLSLFLSPFAVTFRLHGQFLGALNLATTHYFRHSTLPPSNRAY
jgi:hypothetical protein